MNKALELGAPTRNVSLDLIRLISIFFVVCIHVSAVGFQNFSDKSWTAINFYDSFSRISVPLFFMVTGALLVPRVSEIKSIIQRVIKVLIPLIAWSAVYLTYFQFSGVETSPSILNVISGPVVYHLWYLYTLIGAYLFLPVMSGFYRANKVSTLLFVMSLWFVGVSLVPTFAELTGITALGIDFTFLSWVSGFFVLGALLTQKVKMAKVPNYAFGLLSIISGTVTAIGTWWVSNNSDEGVQIFYRYFAPFVIIGAISTFVFFSKFSSNRLSNKPNLRRKITNLSKLSFGIYLVHPFLIYILAGWGLDLYSFNAWLSIPTITTLVFLVSMLFVFLMQKIPLIRQIVPS